MSMYRQLWLALILSTVLALIGGFLASTLSARTYLQEHLRLRNNDTASALALSLSRSGVDQIEMELATAALFDSGHFEFIHIVDPTGALLVERNAAPVPLQAPSWFVRQLPLSAPAGVAKISDGWKQIGTVTLASQNSFAYQSLWRGTRDLIIALLISGLIAAYLGTLILRRLKRPLDRVIEQARAISDRRFFMTPEPRVPELRQLAAAMNFSVSRLKSMFDEEALRLESVRREANHDGLTGLANRAFFMARLRGLLDTQEGLTGHLFLIRIAHLADINRRLGREQTDALLKRVGTAIGSFTNTLPDGLAARLNGADFAVLLPGQWDGATVANELLQQLVSGASPFLNEKPVAFIGAGAFRSGQDIGAVMAQVDGALSNAEASEVNSVRLAASEEADDFPASTEQWGRTIRDALDHGRARLALFPVVDFAGSLIHRESALRLQLSEGGEWLPAGRFLSIAERLGISALLDISVVKLGLAALEQDAALPGLAINLSARSIHDAAFRQQLKVLIKAHAAASRRLWLEVPEHGVLAHLPSFRSFCLEFSACGCRLGVEHFGLQFSQIGKLHDLGLHYLKVDGSFVREIETNLGNQAFLKGLTGISHGIGLQVFAEGVASDAELSALRALGFNGATGPAVKDSV